MKQGEKVIYFVRSCSGKFRKLGLIILWSKVQVLHVLPKANIGGSFQLFASNGKLDAEFNFLLLSVPKRAKNNGQAARVCPLSFVKLAIVAEQFAPTQSAYWVITISTRRFS